MTTDHNGHTIKVNGHAFKVTIRDVAYVITLGLSIVGLYFLTINRQNTADAERAAIVRTLDAISQRITEMDKNGTHRSHETDSNQQQQIDYNTKEIAEQKHALTDLAPKVDKIDTNVLWLMAKQLEHK